MLKNIRKSILIYGNEELDEIQDAVELGGIPVKDIIQDMEAGKLTSPISLWAEIINNPEIYDLKTRMTAAKDMSSFTHKKQPTVEEIHQITDNQFNVKFIE